MFLKLPSASAIERLPWWARTLLGCGTGLLSVGLTYAIPVLHAFPLLIAFPAVIIASWFFNVAGSFGCAIVAVTLVDVLLTNAQFQFSSAFTHQETRVSLFLVLSTLLGLLIRRLADQRMEMQNQDLKKSLILEQAQRQMAEERARAGDALQERDELLQISLRANGMGVWMWDLGNDTMHRSDEVYRMAGREPGSCGDEPEAWIEFVHEDDREGLKKAFAEVRASGKDLHHQYRVRCPDGSIRWLESQGKCQRDNENRVSRIVGVMADVSHRKRAEEAMLRAEKLAVAGRLAASVAHEINNPLEAVTNLLYLITLSDSTEAAQAHAQRALDELLRVSLITQSTLKFHRQPGSPKITMLSEIVDGIVALFRPRIMAAGIDLKVEVVNEVAIACMPSEAQQIFVNLMANAIEAMPRSGQLTIRLRASRDWRKGAAEGMRVTFMDSGVGMDRATMRRIFEPFFTTKPETGTGLGMWVVHQLVERHGGHIRMWSTPRYGASGTVVSIFLPAGQKEVEGVEFDNSASRSLPVERAFDPIPYN
jgi:PAS domain S-box-containing protein